MARIFVKVEWPHDKYTFDRDGNSYVAGGERRERLVEVFNTKKLAEGIVQGESRNGTPILAKTDDLVIQ